MIPSPGRIEARGDERILYFLPICSLSLSLSLYFLAIFFLFLCFLCIFSFFLFFSLPLFLLSVLSLSLSLHSLLPPFSFYLFFSFPVLSVFSLSFSFSLPLSSYFLFFLCILSLYAFSPTSLFSFYLFLFLCIFSFFLFFSPPLSLSLNAVRFCYHCSPIIYYWTGDSSIRGLYGRVKGHMQMRSGVSQSEEVLQECYSKGVCRAV